MYQVKKTAGEYEPWWFFDNWESSVVASKEFADFTEAKTYFLALKDELSQQYVHQQTKKNFLTAFWNDQDVYYCEECGDDVQFYQGLMLLENNHPLSAQQSHSLVH